MSNLDYKKFEEWLYRDCCRILNEFSMTENNKDVYSFCIYTELGQGSIVLFINTLESSKRINSDGTFYGLRNPKYRIDETGISFRFSQEIEEFALERSREEWVDCEGWDPLIKSTIRVCNQLGEQFNLLHQTGDFIAFTAIHDMDYDQQILLMKETVPLEILFAALPEIAQFEAWLESLQKKNKEEQMDYCLSIYEDFLTGTNSEKVKLLKDCRRDKQDLIKLIKNYRKDISPRLLTLLQKYAKSEELNHDYASLPREERNRKWKEDKTLSVWTKEGKITHELIDLVVSVGDTEMVEPLHKLLQFWFTKTNTYPYDHIGLNVALLSRALRSLAPDQFPYPTIGGRDNRLEDYYHFDLTK